MTNSIADLEEADVILVTGSNTTENHPVISSSIKRAVRSGGTQLIVVDPRQITLSEFADHYLRPAPGTDVAWINGLIHVILKEGLHDSTFIRERTEDVELLKNSVAPFTPDYVAQLTGIAVPDIIAAARLYGNAGAAAIVYCMGITQHIAGTDNVKSLANLAMLCGNVGIRGGGVNPLRGQNNVQGACDMGGLPNVYTAYQPVTSDDITRTMEKAWRTSGLSTTPGLTATEMVPKAHSGEVKALYIIGENPLVSDPDLAHAEASFDNLEFLVVQDIFMTETAQRADVVLPSLCFAEKDGTFSNTERRVQRIRKAVDGPGLARSDWEILSDLSTRMGYAMSYGSSEEIFDEMRSVTPSYRGISYQRIEKEGLHWPCPTPEHPGTPILHRESFTRGRGKFHAIAFTPPAENPDADYPLILTTGRLLYQYHTGTMTRKTEGLNERAPECYIEMAPADAHHYGLHSGEMATIYSRRGKIRAVTRISPMAAAGTVFLPFHFAEAAANRLTNAALDPVAKIPEYKVCAVQIAKQH